ncbi:hypothetical protein [Sporosarcina sp. E16_8]|uniref:hypothetical protein n=1 Tax=Sporosarcina sp. E16_8 TaxID=2789295 RepID=UPI001A914BFA|nr:hypothetical protein [Sporosarcina sp. E16_8]MBO0586151.1 hypothetical protein [Sporosarcina sp. E16_8]
MTFGEMLGWTNRLKEIKEVKDSYLRVQRMQNLMNDFRVAYGGNLNKSNDRVIWSLYLTLDQEHFAIV